MSVDRVLTWLEKHEREGVDRMIDWLRIPSISTDPAYAEECRRAADWAAEHLRGSGFTAEVLPTGERGQGRPAVLADCGGDGPRVLFYGHYDVQPPEPLELWDSPPFEPVIRPAEPDGPGERVVARGAVDDKGQVMTFLEAMRAWKEAADLPGGGVRWTVLLEGEEECASANLGQFLEEHKGRIEDCACCVISDTGMLARGKPAITTGIRGLCYTEVTLHGPDRDLHSGQWGGRCPNPASELVKVLSGLWDENRRVTIPGFYDDVKDVPEQERAAWKQLGFDQIAALRGIGLPPEADVGEAGFTAIEREWCRPTAEINGIYGGYTATGAKTIIPSKASAKVSFRLVSDQRPQKVRDLFFQWLEERTPAGCRWEFSDHGGGSPATIPNDAASLESAKRAVERAAGVPPAIIRTGGSIPIAGMLRRLLNMDTIFMGFGLDDDRVHSPNEKFELDCYRLGLRSHALLADELRSSGV